MLAMGVFMFDFYSLRKNKVHRFQPKIQIFSEKGSYILKTVADSEELIQALQLRYQVFHREMIGKKKSRGVDVDEFDFVCDHLVIIDQRINKIIGTYRLNSSLFSNRFYSSGEFNIRQILETEGNKLELGRACIHQEYRNGIVISLLWRGIAEYMQKSNSEILFGCASIKTESPRQAALLYQHFASEERYLDHLLCPPTLKYSMPGIGDWIYSFQRPLTDQEKQEATDLIPPLCRAYLKAGAVLGGEPAYDAEFKCIDFLTILRRDNLNRALWKKYDLNNKTKSEAPTQIQPVANF